MLSSRFALKITYPVLLLCGLLSFSHVAFSQVPQLINYQAVARSTVTGQELADTEILVVISILAEGPLGDQVYQEEHNTNSNQFGLFSLQIGGGTGTDDFGAINWGAANYWLRVDIDAGEGLQTVSTTQLVSVPYALYAASAGNVDDDDANPENELNESLSFNEENSVLSITDAGGTISQDLSSLVDDDANPENELIDSLYFDESTSIISVTDAGGTYSQNLSSLQNDDDADPGNEFNNSFDFDAETQTLSISDNGGTFSENLSSLINDADADPENELIEPGSFSINEDQTLSITENNIEHTVDLSGVFEDDDWQYNDDETAIYNIQNRVGIGTISPVGKFEVKGNDAGSSPLITARSGLGDDDPEVFTARNNKRAGVNVSDPNSSFQVNGSYAGSVNYVTANLDGSQVMDEEDQFIVVKFSASGLTYSLHLPPASSCAGRVYHIKKLANGFFSTLNLQPDGSDQIDGASTFISVGNITESGRVSVVSAGANGWIVFSN